MLIVYVGSSKAKRDPSDVDLPLGSIVSDAIATTKFRETAEHVFLRIHFICGTWPLAHSTPRFLKKIEINISPNLV
jgi:hypothetical protein